jgi:2-polyprenyl-3-methyl-5-hydroxy-6-metoxy-1,4-benzoquinol methylase
VVSINGIRSTLVARRRLRSQGATSTLDASLIDYRCVVARYSFAEHAARADHYFSSLDFRSPISRKPFANPLEAAEICGSFAALLPDIQLFRGARVLDFGAGTCWLSRLLALLGCEVTAIDVSRKALEVGEWLIRGDALGDQLSVRFVPLENADLPFGDETFDRVLCFIARLRISNSASRSRRTMPSL